MKHHRLNVRIARPPAELALDLARVRVEYRRVARPGGAEADGHLLACDLLDHLDDLEHGVGAAVTHLVRGRVVVRLRVRVCGLRGRGRGRGRDGGVAHVIVHEVCSLERGEQHHVGLDQVRHVNVVAL